MKRREFITLLGGAAAAWPLAARAQQPRADAARSACSRAWPRTIRTTRYASRHSSSDCSNWAGPTATMCGLIIALPQAIPKTIASMQRNWSRWRQTSFWPLAVLWRHMLQATRTVPIVFAFAADPVGSGFVESLSRPGGNATGFLQFEYDLSAKWLELLKEIAPGVTRAAVLRDPTAITGIGQFAVIQSVARSVGVEVSPINLRDAGETERAVTAFARSSNGGLIVTASALASVQRNLIVELAARYRLPAVYFERLFVASGGLISYGADLADQYRRAAGYVDRILKGEKPADLPVQAPTKYELVINLKTAKALGLDVPRSAARPRRRGDRVM